MKLLDDKTETRNGFGFLKFNCSIQLRLYPLDICLLPFYIVTKYKKTETQDKKWYFTFRWLIFFVSAFHKY